MPSTDSRLYPTRFNPRYYLLSELRRALEEHIEKYSLKVSSNVLDYGCGTMPYRPLFSSSIEYIGADIASNDKAHCILNSDGTVPLEDNSVECIISTQVLEHVDSPELYLNECFRVLKNNSYMILSTHGTWRYHPQPGDYWRWTSEGLKQVIERSGFQVSDVKGILGLGTTGAQLFHDAFKTRLPRFLSIYFTYWTQIMLPLIDRIHSTHDKQRDAAIFVVVVQKL